MLKPPNPPDEVDRLQALHALQVLDMPAEERFDRFTRIAQQILQVPIVLISLVDEHRQWFKSSQGLDASETPRDISFCGHAILGADLFVVPDASADPRFADNPLVAAGPEIRFYIGAPLALSDGHRVGTLCAIDRQPRQLSTEQHVALRDLAQCVAEELERTVRRQRVAQLANMEARHSSIINSSDEAIFSKTLEGILTSWNPAAERLFGYTATEAIGQPSTLLLLPSQILEEAQRLQRIQQGKREEQFETIRLHKDGTPISVAVRVSPILDQHGSIVGTSALVRDISAQQRAETALRESSQLVKSILETVIDGIITIDSSGKVLSFNNAAERLFGYYKEEVIGNNVNCLMPEPYAAEHDGYLARFLNTGQARGIGIGSEVVGRRKDGSTFPMELAVGEMPQSGASLFVGIVRDITERKQVERLKGEFVSTVSHELRTPLTSIRGALGLILGKFAQNLPPKGQQLLDTAQRNCERLTLLINDILDLEKIESGRIEFEFKTLDLTQVTRQALAANEGYAQQHGVELCLVDAPPQALVWADEHRLLQIFANLLSNAIKYSPTGKRVEVTLSDQGGHFRVSVRDFGRGIPASFRKRMFQRFVQADSSDTREKGGTGLGLSITKALVERHGGRIDYDSEVGGGSLFFFDLPDWLTVASPQQQGETQPRLLLCEENLEVANILKEILKRARIDCDHVATADAALEMARRHPYRGLLLDIALPHEEGLTLLRTLRQNEATQELPVIVISNHPMENAEGWDLRALRVLDWLQKPIDSVSLNKALLRALSRENRPHILHVEDDRDIIQITQALLEEHADYTYATSLSSARQELAIRYYDLLLLDLTLPDGSGLELLNLIPPTMQVIVFSEGEVGNSVKQQVAATLTKATTGTEQLLNTIRRAINPQVR